jgi:hypothetical protein
MKKVGSRKTAKVGKLAKPVKAPKVKAAKRVVVPKKTAVGKLAPRAAAPLDAAPATSVFTGTVFLDPNGRASLVEGATQTLMTCDATSCSISGFDAAFVCFQGTPPGQQVSVEGFKDICDLRPALHVVRKF